MPGSQLSVRLFRDSFNTPWGFRLQGGKDLNQPLTVQRVFSNSPAEGELQRGDIILAIGGDTTQHLSHKQAQDCIKNSGGQINLIVNRPPPGCVHISPLSPPVITQRPRAPSLQDFSPSNHSSPQRPHTIQIPSRHPHPHTHHNNISVNHNSYSNTAPPNHAPRPSMRRQHNVPIHVHIEPSRPHSGTQTTYMTFTPSPTTPQYRKDPYGTMPRRQRGISQPPFQSPTTPTIPPPPWATQQCAPKKVSKLSKLGGGGDLIGSSFRSSTLPRRSSYQAPLAQHYVRKPAPKMDETDAPDLFQEKKPTGPPPKVCSLSNLGGGAVNFASGPQESHTLPRRNISRRSSQPPSMPSRGPTYQQPPQFGADYGRPNITPAQRYEPTKPNEVMLNRVQSSLDNITLSPRTPDAGSAQPVFYTPTHLLLDHQKMEEERQMQLQMQQQRQQNAYRPPPPQPQQYYSPVPVPQPQFAAPNPAEEGEEEEEPVVPVWELRKKFQEPPKVRTPRQNPVPKVQRPAGKSASADFGLSYRPQNQQSNAVWQPISAPQPVAQAPAKPNIIQITPVYKPVQSPVKATPPSWQRTQASDDETDRSPAWGNTLRSTGVKPWDVDLSYNPNQEEAQRSVPYDPTPYQNLYSPGPPADAADGPKVVHLQYNSPMGLYSNENVAETYQGQTKALSGGQHGGAAPPATQQAQGGGQGLPEERDWSQSQVLAFIQQDGSKKPRGGKAGPATAPKPQQQKKPQQVAPPAQHHRPQVALVDDVGISDF